VAAEILYGKPIEQAIKKELAPRLAGCGAKVVALQNRSDAACRIYSRMQERLCQEFHLTYDVRPIHPDMSQGEAEKVIRSLNQDPSVTGITVHLPLPEGWDTYRLLRTIDPDKDVEGVHPHNLGMLSFGEHWPVPCAAAAAVEMVKRTVGSLKGLEVVVVGHSAMVGKPIAFLLLQSKLEAPTPTVCHVATRDLAFHTRRADVLFVAVGKAGLIRGEMVKPGSVVVDIGVNKLADGQVVGDVAFKEVAEKARAITPVPGGLGPVTLAILLRNIVECAERPLGRKE
jgi:methylenetetrahydrofolate dehydrogenase (NADP+)/methenyltetrahydrofolate cyclohydrolase